MEVFKKTISAVFGTDHRYLIPLFQRAYVWSKESQWEPLWDPDVEQFNRTTWTESDIKERGEAP